MDDKNAAGSGHAPGPWAYKMVYEADYAVIRCGQDVTLSGFCGEATARLIAASPELLEALIELEDVLGRMQEAGECGHIARLKRARAAIAKATRGAA